jgi:hypothetical protein
MYVSNCSVSEIQKVQGWFATRFFQLSVLSYVDYCLSSHLSEFSTRINLTSDELKLSSQNIITINNKKKYGIDFLIIEEYYY